MNCKSCRFVDLLSYVYERHPEFRENSVFQY